MLTLMDQTQQNHKKGDITRHHFYI